MMAIETGPAGNAQSSAVNGANHAPKHRNKGPDANAGAGTFSSLLNGMGAQADEDALAAQANDADADSDAGASRDASTHRPNASDAPDATGAAHLAGTGQPPVADSVDASGGQAKDLPGRAAKIGGAAALGRQDAALADADAAAGETAGADALSRLQDAGAIGGAEQSADSIAELLAELKGPGASARGKADGALAALPGASTHTSTVGLGLRGAHALGLARAAASRAMGSEPATTVSNFGQGLGAGRNAAAQADVRDTKSMAGASTLSAADSTASITAQLLAAADTGGGAAQDKSREKPGGQAAAAGALPGGTAEPAGASSAGAPGETGFAAALAGQPLTPEELLANQVSYLITQKTQSAELKLDGFGDQPVEVSISMHGNEAQVAFRSDHAQAREMLENAMPHLKEMLQSEGLLLSGMSVGTSSQGGAQAGGRQGGREEGAGAGTGKPEPLAMQAAAPRPSRPAGVVDVFA